jgi:hypothetical protein
MTTQCYCMVLKKYQAYQQFFTDTTNKITSDEHCADIAVTLP